MLARGLRRLFKVARANNFSFETPEEKDAVPDPTTQYILTVLAIGSNDSEAEPGSASPEELSFQEETSTSHTEPYYSHADHQGSSKRAQNSLTGPRSFFSQPGTSSVVESALTESKPTDIPAQLEAGYHVEPASFELAPIDANPQSSMENFDFMTTPWGISLDMVGMVPTGSYLQETLVEGNHCPSSQEWDS
ncbi:hypothetical protein DPSP01_014418 [Paraphaeosphaeria sporulosa]